ncbi:MAG: hypothetical protein HY544_04225 [Candidatus Diapherotrites archaeon]|uniref:Uncharacterized protein n=1 Tax=Candidatus Iainarchaeum sp. TaxID=3101447 RepID=A0A8T3YJH8_9ARCH|nr:hypothetical protein [Candidatus Diapherotrites archaeon]
MTQETVTVPRKEYESLKRQVEIFKESNIYKRLIEFENNIAAGKKFYREDLGF